MMNTDRVMFVLSKYSMFGKEIEHVESLVSFRPGSNLFFNSEDILSEKNISQNVDLQFNPQCHFKNKKYQYFSIIIFQLSPKNYDKRLLIIYSGYDMKH